MKRDKMQCPMLRYTRGAPSMPLIGGMVGGCRIVPPKNIKEVSHFRKVTLEHQRSKSIKLTWLIMMVLAVSMGNESTMLAKVAVTEAKP